MIQVIFGAGVTALVVKAVFFFFVFVFGGMAIYVKRVIFKITLTSLVHYFDLMIAGAGPALGVLAIWASINNNVIRFLPIDYMLFLAGSVSLIAGLVRTFDPLLNKQLRSINEAEGMEGPKSNSDDDMGIEGRIVRV